ncbi:MAG: diacylglycerol kinase family lipid kinase [Bacteroidales bacterium]|nr:diacylglycerol kinase family lipid kinase [Bacteroidales bacterium]
MDKKSDRNEWLVIVNPNAGNGEGKKNWKKISELLKKEDLPFIAEFTEKRGHAIVLTLDGITAGFRKIITVGGDGTLNEVVNGVFLNKECPTRDISLALIPIGTGNDWSRMFGIPRDYEKAIKIIHDNKLMLHDIGLISFFEGSEKKNRFFINIAGLGFESVVIKRTNTHKEKGWSGKGIYFYNLLMCLLSYKTTRAQIIIDGEKINADIFSINIGNGKYCGGGMRQTPNALPDDGLLDVTIIKGIGKIEIIRNLKILYDGSILSHPKIDGYRCKSLKIGSDSLIYAEADGELLGHTPMEFSIIPASVNIVYGTRLIQ